MRLQNERVNMYTYTGTVECRWSSESDDDLKPVFRIRIRMDPSFFADPNPGFKSQDPDPSIYKLM